MTVDPKELRRTAVGGAVLRGVGAALGAFAAVAAILLLFVVVVNPWLDSVEVSDTEMFGPAEGWLVLFATILLAPPATATASWIGLRCAQRRWSIDHVTPKRWRFAVSGLPLAWVTAGIASTIGGWAIIVAVPVGFGIAGFAVSTALGPPAADRPPPTQPVQTATR